MWTAADLVTSVKLRAMLPTSSSAPGTADADVLAHANDELQSRLVPLLLSINEELLVATTDVTLVAGQAVYRVPDRAAAARLRDVHLVVGGNLVRLAHIEPERMGLWTSAAQGQPQAFVMEAGGLRLIPTPATGSTLRVRYYVRPGQLTTTSTDFAQVLTVTSPTATEFTCTLGSGLTPVALSGYLYDLVSGRPPFETLALDGSCLSAGSGYLMSFTSGWAGLQARLSSIGWTGADYLTLRGMSPVPQVPSEAHPLLIQRTVCRMLLQLGRLDEADRAEREADRLERVMLTLLSPRADGSPRKMLGLHQQRQQLWRWGW